jgi:hypothetical protein
LGIGSGAVSASEHWIFVRNSRSSMIYLSKKDWGGDFHQLKLPNKKNIAKKRCQNMPVSYHR